MKIGLLGAGTIGSGVIELADLREDMQILRILDKRDIPALRDRLTTDPDSILKDEEINTVVEVLGGIHPAFEWVSAALRSGKNVVTANKMLVSEKLSELIDACEEGHSRLRFSAAVGGGIPFLFNLLRARRSDRVLEVGGILNGTTNYILSRMQEDHLDFGEVLLDAQQRGYAEADPTADISGGDAKCKIMLASSIAWNGIADKNSILCEGIEHIHSVDMDKAADMGYTCRLMARAIPCGDEYCITVEPTLVSNNSVPAGVRLVDNMGYWIGEHAGIQRFTGEGAGRWPTSYAIINDLLDLADNSAYLFRVNKTPLRVNPFALKRRYLVRGLNVPGENNGAWILTDPTVPAEIHRRAETARSAGADVFFSGMLE